MLRCPAAIIQSTTYIYYMLCLTCPTVNWIELMDANLKVSYLLYDNVTKY